MKTDIVVTKIHSPITIRNRALEYAGRPFPEQVDPKRRGAVIGNLTDAVRSVMGLSKENLRNRGKDEKLTDDQKSRIEGNSRLVISWLFMDGVSVFEPTSRAELTPQQVNALSKWMSEYVGRFPDGEWRERRMFKDELTWLIFLAGRAYKITTDQLAKGNELFFYELLAQFESEIKNGENIADGWEKTEYEQKMEPQSVLSGNTAESLPKKAVSPTSSASAFDGLPG